MSIFSVLSKMAAWCGHVMCNGLDGFESDEKFSLKKLRDMLSNFEIFKEGLLLRNTAASSHGSMTRVLFLVF